MRQIIEKYNGSINPNYKDEIFIVNRFLNSRRARYLFLIVSCEKNICIFAVGIN